MRKIWFFYIFGFFDFFSYHICRGMTKFHHGSMYCKSLRCGFERMFLEDLLEVLYVLASVCIHISKFAGKDMYLPPNLQNKFENF